MQSDNILDEHSSRNVPAPLAFCPICRESVGASRFAPHLEKCMRGGKRSAKVATTTEVSTLFSDGLLLPVEKPNIQLEDPYPNSLVVRIRVRNGGS